MNGPEHDAPAPGTPGTRLRMTRQEQAAAGRETSGKTVNTRPLRRVRLPAPVPVAPLAASRRPPRPNSRSPRLPRLAVLLLAALRPPSSPAARCPGAAGASPMAPAPAVAAPPFRPPPRPSGRFDDTELRRGTVPARRAPDRTGVGAGAASPDATASGYDLPRVLLALAAVVGLIFLLRWAARRFFALPTARGVFAGRAGVVAQRPVAQAATAPRQGRPAGAGGRRTTAPNSARSRRSPTPTR